ncbi:MAG TPA: multiheme c-type cytochrome [Candidatus Eisenbacteria bacterium]|nr:multiheme c-type cytochrome [Candidatus Eisenbacteria bacterium]
MRLDRIAFLLALSAIALSAAVASAYTPPPVLRSDLNLQSGMTCKTCHIDITEQWQKSAHSKADRNRNLLFGRMYFYSLKQTRGATMVACGPCHETASYVNQDFDKIRDVSSEGVACVFCHSIDGSADRGNPPVSLDISAFSGTLRNPITTPSHKSKYAPYLGTAEFCGSCHKYSNQHGVEISDTYGEWKRSKYPKLKMTCQTCHMPGGPGRNTAEGPLRARVANHAFDHEALNASRPNAVTLKLRGERRGDSLRVFAVVTNAGWGHSLPTGNDQHIAVLRVRVKSAAGEILWENDPLEEWNVAVFGVLLADEYGNAPADTWNARKVVRNRRIKAGESAQVRFDAPIGGASKPGALQVEAQFLLRRARPETIALYGLPESYDAERLLAETKLAVP